MEHLAEESQAGTSSRSPDRCTDLLAPVERYPLNPGLHTGLRMEVPEFGCCKREFIRRLGRAIMRGSTRIAC
jgi:hypothetical protein